MCAPLDLTLTIPRIPPANVFILSLKTDSCANLFGAKDFKICRLLVTFVCYGGFILFTFCNYYLD